MCIKQLFDIDKKDDNTEDGHTALHYAIETNNPIIVELLLKEYDANPNVVNNSNQTTLICWASRKDRNLSILRLLVKYRFDFPRLVNERQKQHGFTAFHFLCYPANVDHNIVCLNHLFSICTKLPNCSINTLARDDDGMCGFHRAIDLKSFDMMKYLLEKVYFPNNDKLSKDGVALINMRVMREMPLAAYILQLLVSKESRNVKNDLEIFELFVSYGMKVNSQHGRTFEIPIMHHYTELVVFILNENLSPIHKFEDIMSLMYTFNAWKYGRVNTEILKALYSYGLEHGLISNKLHHSQIIVRAAQYNLTTFKATMFLDHICNNTYD